MLANQARISKLSKEYDHVDPNAYSDIKSIDNYHNINYFSEPISGGSLYTTLYRVNASWTICAWVKKKNNLNINTSGKILGLWNMRTTSTPTTNFRTYPIKFFSVNNRWGVQLYPRKYNSTSTLTNTPQNAMLASFYADDAGTLNETQNKLHDWHMICASIYKSSQSSNTIHVDFYINNIFIGTLTKTSNEFQHKIFSITTTSLDLFACCNPGGKNNSTIFYISQTAMYYNLNPYPVTIGDVELLYNNGQATDWSNLSLSSGQTLFSNYICGDDPDDTATFLKDQSSNNLDLDYEDNDGDEGPYNVSPHV